MKVDRFLRLTRKRPFRPFSIHLADGRELQVVHPEAVVVDPEAELAAVYTPVDGIEMIDVPLVTSLHYRRKARGPGGE